MLSSGNCTVTDVTMTRTYNGILDIPSIFRACVNSEYQALSPLTGEPGYKATVSIFSISMLFEQEREYIHVYTQSMHASQSPADKAHIIIIIYVLIIARYAVLLTDSPTISVESLLYTADIAPSTH